MPEAPGPAPRRRLPRITIGRLMALVAFVAILAFAWVEYRRMSELGRRYSALAALHLGQEKGLATMLGAAESRAARLESGGDAGRAASLRDYGRDLRAQADHAATLRRKYERAARYPWMTVAPDPPWPE